MGLKLGVACAVIDDEGRVLLSHRADFNLWNLPGGRVDTGEVLTEAAIREVREETGVIAQVDRAIGLYFADNRSRVTVIFAGWPLGGELQQRTDETRANRFFGLDGLPKDIFGEDKIRDAFRPQRPLPTINVMSKRQRGLIQVLLGWRWIKNYLSGRPEPKFAYFHIRAIGVIWDQAHHRVLTLRGNHGRILPRVQCEGEKAPWIELSDSVKEHCRVDPVFQWVGLWQDPTRNILEFIFAATLPEKQIPGTAEWSVIQNVALGDRDLAYIERVKPNYSTDPVWIIIHQDEIGHGDTLKAFKPK